MEAERLRIVLIEDNPADVFMLREAFRRASLPCDVTHLNNGEKAVDLFFGGHHRDEWRSPHLVILDLNLPRLDGLELLRAIRSNPEHRSLPVVVFTSSDSPLDRDAATALGIKAYIVKPSDLNEFMRIGVTLREICATLVR